VELPRDIDAAGNDLTPRNMMNLSGRKGSTAAVRERHSERAGKRTFDKSKSVRVFGRCQTDRTEVKHDSR
jgi:hypothetical protein